MMGMEQESLRDIMTPEQVAAYLQLDTETVYRLIRRKELVATRIGRTYRIPRHALDAFLVAHSTRPEVREAVFARFLAPAPRNARLNTADMVEELEPDAEKRKSPARLA